MRDLTGPTQNAEIRGLLQSLLVGEVLVPSEPLWLLSAWVSDIPIIDNRARQFAAVDPDWPTAFVRLSQVLRTAISRGGSLNVVLRQDSHNDAFIDLLRRIGASFPNKVRLATRPEFHDKGLVARDFAISGSMNFTFNGIEVNDEHLIFRTDMASVANRRLTLTGLWQGQLHAIS